MLSRPRLELLGDRRFLRLWSVGAVSSIVRWLEMLAVGVYVFDVTGSPLQVALFTLLRMLPLGLFGAFGGALGDHGGRNRIMTVGLVCMCLVSFALATLLLGGRLELWHIGLATFLNGLFWVTDFSVRRPMLAEVAGIARMGRALALDTLAANGSRMLGPLFGGALLEFVGLGGAYLLGAALYVLAVLAMAGAGAADDGASRARENVWRNAAESLGYLRSRPLMTAVLAVTVVFNLWCFPVLAMIPVIGKNDLGLSAFPVGLLMSAEGAGVLLGASAIAACVHVRFYRRLYVGGVAWFACAALVFAHSPSASVAGIALLAAGLGLAAFSSMQSTLVLVHTPPGERGRMMGLLAVCIGSAPLGLLHIGWLADRIATPVAITIVAIEGLAVLALVCRRFPEILRWEDVQGEAAVPGTGT